LAALCLYGSILPATASEAPLVGRPRDYFFGAIGEQVRIEMSAQPTQNLRVEDDLTLTFVIHGAENSEQIQRPDLRQLDEFASKFYIDDLDDGPDPALARRERSFRYRLRPKNESAMEIPPLLFRYWQPRLQYFATTASEQAIELKVQPRTPVEAIGMPMTEPDFLFHVTEGPSVLAQPKPAWYSNAYTVLALLGPALVCGLWYWWWRLRDPGAAALANLRRTRVARAALDEIERLRGPADAENAGRIGRAMLGYLRERFGLEASVVTPAEVAGAISRAGLVEASVERVEAFLRECDAIHFGPAGSASQTLANDARQLILLLEESVWPSA
jgi:hypothetical protein